MQKNNTELSASYLLGLIFLVGLILRLVGIWHGFPLIFHPDEPALVRAALGIRFNINPGHFDWPHFYVYLNYFLYMGFSYLRNLLEVVNLKPDIIKFAPILWDDRFIFYLLTRILSATLGAATVFPIFKISYNLFKNSKAGLFSALFMAVLPFHVLHSHYALIDVPMVFILSWCLFFITETFQRPSLKNYFISGALAGLAASTKYNGALIIPLIVLVGLINFRRTSSFLDNTLKFGLNMAVACIASIGFLILGTPFALLDYKTFIRTDGPAGALWQFSNVGNVSFDEHLTQFGRVLFEKLPSDLGIIPLVLFGFGVLYILYLSISKKFSWEVFLISIPGLILIFYISGLLKPRSHYLMISYPFIALTAGYMLSTIHYYLSTRFKFHYIIKLGLCFAIPLYFSILNVKEFLQTDTRQILYSYLSNKGYSKELIMYYRSNEMFPVIELLPNKYQRTAFEGIQIESRKGLLLFNFTPEEYQEYKLGKNNLLNSKKYLKFETQILSDGKVGPDIVVYRNYD